ncbi:biotin sulfoxide reductase [Tistrella bauzanensis]|uniref:Biotin sulfoxide reductase n=1 Tax=Tistrella bauzanensis TaxID=657419 RepID=A0ABQ1IJE8_9PROT|nr:molybdopterin-dependent oxidoreductase [Tistrella bauzanensis]GGB40878.1 biotin sulfoxide reductase [Tistrella bauzanensis]
MTDSSGTDTVPAWVMTHFGPYRVRPATAHAPLALEPDPADPAPTILGTALAGPDHAVRIRRPAARAGWLKAMEEGAGAGAGTSGAAAGDQGGADHHGRRGTEPFVELPWDEALDLAAAELARIRRTHGPTAIYGGSYGWGSAGWFNRARVHLHRLLGAAGGFTMGTGTYSHGAAERMIPHVLGMDFAAAAAAAPDWDQIASRTGLILSFGGMPLKNAQLDWGGVASHRVGAALDQGFARGMRMLTVAPIADDAAVTGKAAWQPIRPGTDTALILALLHELDVGGLIDEPALDRLTSGWPVLCRHLHGQDGTPPKTPDWAAAITGIPAGTITALAHQLADAAAAPDGRVLIAMAWAVQRHQHGEMAVWAAIALAAALGQIGLDGGGVGIGYGAGGGFGMPQNGRRPGLIGPLPNPAGMEIPVSRFADALLDPGRRILHDGRRITLPEIRLVWWAGGNPFHHHQDINRLRRAWARPDTIIVQDMAWTSAATHADLVLPATGPLERADIGGGLHGATIIAMQPRHPPVGEARDDHAILAAIADRLGCRNAFDGGETAAAALERLWADYRAADAGLPDLATLRALGRIDPAPLHAPAQTRAGRLARFRADPATAPLNTPDGRIMLASDAIAAMGLASHPVFTPADEWLGAAGAVARFPLHLLSPQPATRLHSQMDHAAPSADAKLGGRERIDIHADDAAARGIADGDCVMVFNDRGACLAAARICPTIMAGVVALPTGAWYDPAPADAGPDGTDAQGRPVCRHGNPNLLTLDAGTSPIAQAPSAQSCLVEIRRVAPEMARRLAPAPYRIPVLIDRPTPLPGRDLVPGRDLARRSDPRA